MNSADARPTPMVPPPQPRRLFLLEKLPCAQFALIVGAWNSASHTSREIVASWTRCPNLREHHKAEDTPLHEREQVLWEPSLAFAATTLT
jgi:hypothetical protein